MGRARKEIELEQVKRTGDRHFVYLRHPLRKKTVCFSLGLLDEVADNLKALNEIFLNPATWLERPVDKQIPDSIWRQWLGPDVLNPFLPTALPQPEQQKLSDEVARLKSYNDILLLEKEELGKTIETQQREIEHWSDKKLRKEPYPTLKDARDKWIAGWQGRVDPEYAKTVGWDLDRFVKQFGADTKIDQLEGKERDIDTWLRGLQTPAVRDETGEVTHWKPISASRLMQIRVYVLKMLSDSGVELNRKKISRINKKELRKGRGAIKWLTREQAAAIAKALPPYFADAFRIQCAVGLRPDEVLTLHRSNFNPDYSRLTLEPLQHLSLKTGSRLVPIPADLRALLELRARASEILFPELQKHRKRGKTAQAKPFPIRPWTNPKMFTRRFKKALSAAAKIAGVLTPMDSRIGRRSCASWLLQDNISAEKIAALLGNSPAMILDHYGDPDVEKLDLNKMVLSAEGGSATKQAVS